jgi:cobalt-zinc-cadmium efflux system protein
VTRQHRLLVALFLNVGIIAVQLGFGVFAHSLGLLADAGHNFTDVAALATSLLAVRWALRQPNERRSFGYHRATVLAALLNAATIIAVTVLIVFEGIRRLIHPSPVHGGVVVVVALVAAVINGVSALVLREHHDDHDHAGERDLNMRSALLHMVGDAAASVGVAIAGAIIWITGGFYRLDPAISIAIGVLIAAQALRLTWQALHVLLESTPSDIDVDELSAYVASIPGVAAVHDLHVWSLSSEVRALSAHVVLDNQPSLADAQTIGERVKACICDRYAIAHTTLELESEPCAEGDVNCAMHDDRALHVHR